MKISVLIIAHNEEEYIERCIESVLKQTLQPDEIVVVCHSCTDQTVPIAHSFSSVKVVQYDGPEGVALCSHQRL